MAHVEAALVVLDLDPHFGTHPEGQGHSDGTTPSPQPEAPKRCRFAALPLPFGGTAHGSHLAVVSGGWRTQVRPRYGAIGGIHVSTITHTGPLVVDAGGQPPEARESAPQDRLWGALVRWVVLGQRADQYVHLAASGRRSMWTGSPCFVPMPVNPAATAWSTVQ